jgi:ribonucleoside-diphosphate reductase alpha chain
MSDKNIYDQLSEERKQMQLDGSMPEWYSTGSWQMFKSKYLYEASTVKEQFIRIATTAAKHLKSIGKEEEAKEWFFKMLWNGWLSPSSPILSNMGTNRGMPVSCSGSYVEDSIDGFYSSRRETALLTKYGFGTSGDLSDIRSRGSKISTGGVASGVLPVFKGFIQDMRETAQGTSRRGAFAAYLNIEHGDFDEIADFVKNNPDDANIGWIVKNSFIDRLENNDLDAVLRYQKALTLKMLSGKGYFIFLDKVNSNRPQSYVDNNLYVRASNLCSEVLLFSDKDHTYTCVLSSMNLARYHEWKDTDAVYWATIFLDCVAEEFIQKATGISGLEKAVASTVSGRALGLGVMGFHTMLQQDMIPFESFEAHMRNHEVFKRIKEEAVRASKFMAIELGEPEWCKGLGIRNTHLMAIAPTKSTANLMGGPSEGINPDPGMTYTATGSAGDIERVNPVLLKLMKEKNVYNKKVIDDISKTGSIQHVEWLSTEEKLVFRTAFEINQEVVLRLASVRGRYIDQWQSLNLFFGAEETEERISEIHQIAFRDPNILGLYYVYTKSGVVGSEECLACQ